MSRRKWVIVIVAVCLAAIVYVALFTWPPAPEVVRAQAFELVDDQGKLRAELGLLPDGGPGLSLFDEKGVARAGLMLDAGGCANLMLYDENLLPARLALWAGDPVLTFYDERGEKRAGLALWADGQPALTLADEKGKGRAMLVVLPDGPRLLLHDEKDKVLWEAP